MPRGPTRRITAHRWDVGSSSSSSPPLAKLNVAGQETSRNLITASTGPHIPFQQFKWGGPPHVLLERWLGYRLDPSQAAEFHEFIRGELNDGDLFVMAHRVLVNPLRLFRVLKERASTELGFLSGVVHGDLHGGNVLVHRSTPESSPYWLIDLARSHIGPAGFDHAYLEMALIIGALGESDPARLIPVLQDLDGERALVTPEALWLNVCLKTMRERISVWQQSSQPRRADVIERQFWLARVAAGLNWANKPLTPARRRIALTYAAWASNRYLQRHEPQLLGDLSLPSNAKAPAPAPEGADKELWRELWDSFGGFSAAGGRMVLVAEAQDDLPRLRALGQLPWSVVIDLDPSSDEKGLHRHAVPVLEGRRSVHTFSRSLLETSFTRGTAWMMAGGWKLKRESATQFSAWRYEMVPVLQQLFRRFEEQVNPDPINVLVLPGASLDPTMPMARLNRVASTIDEMTRGRARIFVLGHRSPTMVPEVTCQHIPLEPGVFLENVEASFGVGVISETPEVPGMDGTLRPVPVVTLRALEENLEVLHSRVPDQTMNPDASESGSFWRGRPPTWSDFFTGLDIQRSIHDQLVIALRDKLEESRNHTIVLNHSPGAGGTTAALRAAWDLRREYPTAILRRDSSALAGRLQALFNIAERPVLLVAEASDLTESAREDLHRELRRRNCRVVVLYVRRTMNDDPSQEFCLLDPMPVQEARAFQHAYSRFTDESRRRDELARITNDKELARYRSPFFYGLITFEREFVLTERYVQNHLQGIRGRARQALQHLAVVTIYSNTGLHEGVFRQLLGLSESADVVLEEMIGPGPARLVAKRGGRLRLLHQVIAEEVLTLLGGESRGDWKQGLRDLAVDLIRDVTRAADPDSDVVHELFRQIFVDRQAGGDQAEDRQDFSPLIEDLDAIGRSVGHGVLLTLTECCPSGPHFWNHLGRHQVYRVERDGVRAEQYLEQAIRLSPNDGIHYHTRGLVRRSQLRQFMNANPRMSAVDLIKQSRSLFERASEDFLRTRELNPENVYGFVTHVQMILEVADHIRRACGVESIAHIEDEVAEWLQEHIATADRLLDDAQLLYGTLEHNDHYLTGCLAKLKRLFGNVNEVIQLWEVANAKGGGSPASRRALASAYLTRSGHRWGDMQLGELRRVVELMETNMASSGRRDEDYRLWFEACKLIPEFSVDDALGRLRIWEERFPTWRAAYYTYVLHFVLWFEGRSNSLDEMERALERCKELVHGKRTLSHFWLGIGKGDCPLVSSSDLEWDRSKSFWRSTASLRRVNGVIEDIPGPQSGTIRIDGRVGAFFVPGKTFLAHHDENRAVNLILGFSPVGLRAWEVARGNTQGGERRSMRLTPELEPVMVEAPALSEELKLERLSEARLDRVMKFAGNLIKARGALGAALPISELSARIEAAFGVDEILRIQGRNLEQLLRQSPDYELVEGDDDLVVRTRAPAAMDVSRGARTVRRGKVISIHRSGGYGFIADGSEDDVHFRLAAVVSSDREKIASGMTVEFTPDRGVQGPIAVGIRIVGAPTVPHLQGAELAEAVRAAAQNKLEVAGSEGVSLLQLSTELEGAFPAEMPLARRLNVEKISQFLRDIPEVTMEGDYPDLRVRSRRLAFGRLPPARKPAPQPSSPTTARKPTAGPTSGTASDAPSSKAKPVAPRVAADPALAARIREFVRQLAREADQGGAPIRLTDLGHRLRTLVPGEGHLPRKLGYKTLTDFLFSIPEISVEGQEPHRHIWLARPEGAPRPPVAPSPPAEPLAKTTEDVATFRAQIVTLTRTLVDAADPATGIALTALGTEISTRFPGAGRPAKRLGHSTLSRFIAQLPDFALQGDGPEVRIVRRREAAASSTVAPEAGVVVGPQQGPPNAGHGD